jgi:hypothetical protein
VGRPEREEEEDMMEMEKENKREREREEEEKKFIFLSVRFSLWFGFFFPLVLGIKPRALCMLGKCSKLCYTPILSLWFSKHMFNSVRNTMQN